MELQRVADGPWSEYQTTAQDAASALAYALRCRRNGEADESAWAARRAYETIDNYVINHEGIDTNEPGTEMLVLSHPLIQAELTRQNRDVEELRRGAIRIECLEERSKAESAVFLPSNGANPV